MNEWTAPKVKEGRTYSLPRFNRITTLQDGTIVPKVWQGKPVHFHWLLGTPFTIENRKPTRNRPIISEGKTLPTHEFKKVTG